MVSLQNHIPALHKVATLVQRKRSNFQIFRDLEMRAEESKGGGPSPLIGSRAGPMVKVYENKQLLHEKRPKLEVIDEIP